MQIFITIVERKFQKRPKKIENNLLLKEYINSKIKLDWSPQQIANRLKKEAYPLDMSMRVSHETIYTYLYCLPRGTLRKELMSHLRKERAERQKRGTVHKMRRMIPDMVSISERPKEGLQIELFPVIGRVI